MAEVTCRSCGKRFEAESAAAAEEALCPDCAARGVPAKTEGPSPAPSRRPDEHVEPVGSPRSMREFAVDQAATGGTPPGMGPEMGMGLRPVEESLGRGAEVPKAKRRSAITWTIAVVLVVAVLLLLGYYLLWPFFAVPE